MNYYNQLPTVTITFLDDTTQVFEHAKTETTGDFVVVSQKDLKTVLPLANISTIQNG